MIEDVGELLKISKSIPSVECEDRAVCTPSPDLAGFNTSRICRDHAVLVWANGYLIAHIKLADIMAACLLNITVLRSQIWKPSRKWNIHTADLDRITPPQVLFVTLNTIKQSRQCWCHQWSAFTTLTCLHSKWKVTPTLLILWNVIMEAPPDLADLVHATLAFPFDFHFNRWYLLLMY